MARRNVDDELASDVLVDIPRIDKQIAICDQYAQTIFISQDIHHHNFWAGLQKNQLKQYPGIIDVPFDELADRLGPLLFGDTPAIEDIKA